MRFNYLRDAPPDWVDYLGRVYALAYVRTIASFVAMGAVVVLCAWALERIHLHEARAQLSRARERLDRNVAAVVRVNAEEVSLRRLSALDRRLRRIHLSAALRVVRVVDLARRLPSRVWVTSIASGERGDDIEGRAIGLAAIALLLRNAPGMTLVDVHATESDEQRHVLEFRTRTTGP